MKGGDPGETKQRKVDEVGESKEGSGSEEVGDISCSSACPIK